MSLFHNKTISTVTSQPEYTETTEVVNIEDQQIETPYLLGSVDKPQFLTMEQKRFTAPDTR